MSSSRAATGVLRRAVGRGGYFALAFGAIVGSGWVVVLGDWLKAAGPGGSAVAFGIGAMGMLLIALCYGELAARFPRAGAEFLYVREVFGPNAGFIAAWYLTLYAVAVCAFEGIALGWILRTLWPPLDMGNAYTVLGTTVSWGSIATGFAGALIVGGTHCRGPASAIRFQNLVTYGFILISAVLMAAALARGRIANLQPIFPNSPAQPLTNGVLWIFATCAFFLNGWQSALHAIEERRDTTTLRGAVSGMAAAVAAAALFYVGLIIAAGMAVPWQRLPGADLPAVAAFRSLTAGGLLGTVLLAAAAISLAKAWSAMVWVGSRLLFAQARHGLLPRQLLRVHPVSGAPRAAIITILVVTLVGILAGRGAVLPIVNMVSTCMALSYLLCLAALLKARRRDGPSKEFAVPGGMPSIVMALLGAAAMVGLALGKPWLDHPGTVPLEWIMLLSWGAVGACVRAVVLLAARLSRPAAECPP